MMAHPLRIGLKLSGQDCTVDELRSVWRIADEAGFDHLWAFDHLASIGGGGPDRPVLEGWGLLSAMAAVTNRVRIGLLVTGNTYRHPAVLAKLATTADHLSGGRLEFGVGAGWSELEHRMLGIDGLDHRVGRLSEALRVIRSLWTEERTNFAGRYYRLTDAISNPKPVQKPHPPILIGAGGETMLRLTARYADAWNPSGPVGGDLGSAVRASAQLDERCAEIGRDPTTIRRTAQLRWDGRPEGLVETVGPWVQNGFREVVLIVGGPDAPRDGEAAAQLLPELRKLG
jgi:F420-dependent oxidoreductase-like protein